MSSVKIENSSNETVAMVIAYNYYNDNLIAEGWWQIPPNQLQTFNADDAADLYLRVQSQHGDEITFSHFDSFLFWTIPQDRFTLSKKPDDSAVQVLCWGSNLENTSHKTVNQPFPGGWSSHRFFRVGPGDHAMQIHSPVRQHLDAFWLDDNALARISRQVPSTNWGKELMRDAWPKLYQGLLSSDTYRGCASALSKLCTSLRRGISISDVEQIIEGVDQSLKKSHTPPLPSDLLGGAGIVLTNVWERTHSGLTADHIAAACESELIYAAQMFLKARQHEMAGEKLP